MSVTGPSLQETEEVRQLNESVRCAVLSQACVTCFGALRTSLDWDSDGGISREHDLDNGAHLETRDQHVISPDKTDLYDYCRGCMPVEQLDQEIGRFKIWCGNLGALQIGASSLDVRIRDSTVLRSTILSHLEQLSHILTESLDITTGRRAPLELASPPDDISATSTCKIDQEIAQVDSDDDEQDDRADTDDSERGKVDSDGSDAGDSTSDDDEDDDAKELSLHLSAIHDILGDLNKISFRLRNTSTRLVSTTRLKAYTETDNGIDRFDAYETCDRHFIEESLFHSRVRVEQGKDEHEPIDYADGVNGIDYQEIISKNGYLIHRVLASMKLRRRTLRYWQRHARKLAAVVEPDAQGPLSRLARRPRQQLVKPGDVPTRASDSATNPSISRRTILSGTEASLYNTPIDTLLDAQSVISYASTALARDDGLRIPGPPIQATKGQEFVCPYCSLLCPAHYGQRRAWISHVLQDLQPYICTYQSCATGDTLYASRGAWLEHERLTHRRIWQCSEHPDLHFARITDLHQHLRSVHVADYSNAQTMRLANMSQCSLEDNRDTCPFCLKVLEPGRAFNDHMASHMRRYAVFSICRAYHVEQDDADVDDNSELGVQVSGSRSVLSTTSNGSSLSSMDAVSDGFGVGEDLWQGSVPSLPNTKLSTISPKAHTLKDIELGFGSRIGQVDTKDEHPVESFLMSLEPGSTSAVEGLINATNDTLILPLDIKSAPTQPRRVNVDREQLGHEPESWTKQAVSSMATDDSAADESSYEIVQITAQVGKRSSEDDVAKDEDQDKIKRVVQLSEDVDWRRRYDAQRAREETDKVYAEQVATNEATEQAHDEYSIRDFQRIVAREEIREMNRERREREANESNVHEQIANQHDRTQEQEDIGGHELESRVKSEHAEIGPESLQDTVRSVVRSMQSDVPTYWPTDESVSEQIHPKEPPIRFKDALGRKYNFPWHLCKTWKGIENLIMQAFLHVEEVGDHVHGGCYDLIGPNDEIILPQVWEKMVEPGWEISMYMWPMDTPGQVRDDGLVDSSSAPLGSLPYRAWHVPPLPLGMIPPPPLGMIPPPPLGMIPPPPLGMMPPLPPPGREIIGGGVGAEQSLHSKGRPRPLFFCSIPTCQRATKGFTRKADLQRHVVTVHDNPIRYDCPITVCDRKGQGAFTRKDHFHEHMRDAHAQRYEPRRLSVPTTNKSGSSAEVSTDFKRGNEAYTSHGPQLKTYSASRNPLTFFFSGATDAAEGEGSVQSRSVGRMQDENLATQGRSDPATLRSLGSRKLSESLYPTTGDITADHEKSLMSGLNGALTGGSEDIREALNDFDKRDAKIQKLGRARKSSAADTKFL